MSVSSRKPKKKRNPDPASWRTKLDEEGLQYLDEYRRAKLEAADLSSRNWLSEMIGRVRATSNPSNESEGCAKAIDYSVEILPVADIANIILTALEQEGPRGRKALALLAAIPIHWLWSSYQDVRKHHFANARLTDHQFFWVLGTAIQNIGAPFKTGKLRSTTKGRVNAELLEAILKIRDHEKTRLTYRELKDALQYAQIYVASEEQLRLFVHRAKKQKWL